MAKELAPHVTLYKPYKACYTSFMGQMLKPDQDQTNVKYY